MDADSANDTGRRSASGNGRPDTSALIKSACEQFQTMTGKPVEIVSAVRPADSGWDVEVDVVELNRVPDTMSVLAAYTVHLDENGEVTGYERVRRYTRGQTEI